MKYLGVVFLLFLPTLIAGINSPSEKCYDFIKGFEKLNKTAYYDKLGKKWTIGYGATLYENGAKVKKGDVITEARANDLLKYHVKEKTSRVNSLVKSSVNQNQFDALVSFAYNAGQTTLAKSTLLKKVNAKPNDSSIRNEFMKFIKSGRPLKVAPGLIPRRKAEADLYFSP